MAVSLSKCQPSMLKWEENSGVTVTQVDLTSENGRGPRRYFYHNLRCRLSRWVWAATSYLQPLSALALCLVTRDDPLTEYLFSVGGALWKQWWCQLMSGPPALLCTHQSWNLILLHDFISNFYSIYSCLPTWLCLPASRLASLYWQ